MNAIARPIEPESTPFERMANLAKHVMSVPKSEIDRRDKQWHADRRKALAREKRA